MPKFLHTADIHLTARIQDDYRWEIFPWLTKQGQCREIDAFFIIGDITEKKDDHPGVLVNRLVHDLTKLAEVAPVYILKGNHDYVADPYHPFFGFLSNIPGLRFVTESRYITIAGQRFLFLPHTKTPLTYREPINGHRYDRILFHFAVQGALDGGYEIEEGAPAGLFRNARTIAIGGDIHTPQAIDNAIYCGSPHPVYFGDSFKPRVLFEDNATLKSIPRYSIRKVLARVDSLKELKDLMLESGDQVKVTFNLPRSEYGDWQKIKRSVVEYCKHNEVELCGVDLKEKKQRERLHKVATKPGGTPKQQFEDYCNELNITGTTRDSGLFLLAETAGERVT